MAAIRNVTKETVINSFAFCGIKPDMATVAPVLPQVDYLEFEDAYNPEDFEEGEEVEVEVQSVECRGAIEWSRVIVSELSFLNYIS